MSSLLLPEEALLLHVGPHKTGTTAVQSAFFAASAALREHGVHYPGRSRTPIQAVVAVTGHGPMLGEPPLDIRDWERFVASIPGHGRVVVSSEFFADAVGEAVDRVVTDLGRDRVHVVVTLRPLDKIAPSQWQQYVQNGSVSPLRRWLKKTLREDDPNVSGFWRRHRHDVLVDRHAGEEVGDLLFAVVNLARKASVQPGPALDRANRKFRARFERVEQLAAERGMDVAGAGLEVLDRLWEEVKRTTRFSPSRVEAMDLPGERDGLPDVRYPADPRDGALDAEAET